MSGSSSPDDLADGDVPPAGFPFDAFRRRRFAAGVECPRCGGRAIRWGGFAGRKRYRCRACERTFSDFTGTPIEFLKKIDRWPDHFASAMKGESLRREAARLGFHRNTAFRWRHRLLRAMDASDTLPLEGTVAARETIFPFSEKGRRDLARPARRRGWRTREVLEGRPVWVIAARASNGRVATAVAGPRRPTERDYARALKARRVGTTRLTSERTLHRVLKSFASRSGFEYVGPGRSESERAAVAAYVLRLRGWLRRFRGVATRYLTNYLAWHRFVDRGGVCARDRPPTLPGDRAQWFLRIRWEGSGGQERAIPGRTDQFLSIG